VGWALEALGASAGVWASGCAADPQATIANREIMTGIRIKVLRLRFFILITVHLLRAISVVVCIH
jgi:hypothetical protein